MNIIWLYLVKKNKMKYIDEYFILNFDMSFDLFFVKLKGVLLVLVK